MPRIERGLCRWVISCTLLFCAAPRGASGAVTVILTRHAETAAQPPANPPLSAAGHARAERLAAMLARAGVQAIYVTGYLRTQQTAQPLATQLGLTPETIAAAESAKLADRLRQRSLGTVLVVGHGNTISGMIARLGGPSSIVIGADDYEDLFVLTTGSGPVSCLHLRYDDSGPGSIQKESTMELEFIRSGGFAGMATQVEGKVTLDGTASQVTGSSGYHRKLSADEAAKLQSLANAAMRQPAGPGSPGELRDGYQYDVTVTTGDGKKRSIVTHGGSGVTDIFSWVRTECENIWKFRTGG